MSATMNPYNYYTPREVEWFAPGCPENISVNDKNAVLECSAGEEKLLLKISFPVSGGIRITSQKEGFFKPEALKNITHITECGSDIFCADGLSAAVTSKADSFTVTLSRDGWDKTVTISNNDIRLGCFQGEWKKSWLSMGLEPSERIYGFGERFNTINHRGTEFMLWNVDAWSKGTTAYKNMPVYQSTAGYMLFFNSTYGCAVDAGLRDRSLLSMEFEGPVWDAYFYLGAPAQRIEEYTNLTGKPILPPEWAFRYWAGGGFQVWEGRGKDKYLEVVQDCIDGYKALGINDLAAVFGEGLPFHNKPAYEILDKTGTRMLGWNHPSLMLDTMQRLLGTDELDEIPYFKDPANPEKQAHREVIDFTHRNAVKLMTEYYKPFWDMGLKGTMVDYGEILPIESVSWDGHTGDEMHNLVSYWYNKVYHEAWTERMGEDHILFSRSGCAGCQKWVASFGGDQVSTFEGLRQAYNGMLNLTSCGFTFWGTDIGGYGGPPSDESYIRWLQFGAFNPLMRAHGGGKDRNPWTYGETAVEVFKKLYGLRENILPFIYDRALKAHKTGIPMTMTMQTAFPKIKTLACCEDQYLFCDAFLVCPVLEEGACKKTVYFPSGGWYDLFTGERYSGCGKVSVEAPLEKIPVYVKAGSVIPLSLAQSGRMFDIASNGDKLSALLITPPDKPVENSTVLSENTYRCAPANGFTVSCEKKCDADVLIIYGTDVKSAVADGVSLDSSAFFKEDAYTGIRLENKGFKELSIGF